MESKDGSWAVRGGGSRQPGEMDHYIGMTVLAASCGYVVDAVEGASRKESESDWAAVDRAVDGAPEQARADPVESMFRAKREFLEDAVDGILCMIEGREQMRDEHVRRIDGESCEVKTKAYEVKHWQRGANWAMDRTRSSHEQEILALERERRMAEVECWRDVSRLRLELHRLSGDLQRERGREALLHGLG